ncbi:hypothetical protein ACWIGI_28655 [Nocardia sp. NPDC055321]
MTEIRTLGWLTVGAKVAYVSARVGGEGATEATVEKIGKRDVFVKVNGRSEKFNINHTRARGSNTWLYRSGSSTWDRGVELAPLDDPAVQKMQAREALSDAVHLVRTRTVVFVRQRDVASAVELREAVDTFIALQESQ